MMNLVVASRNKSITNPAPSPYILCRIQFVPENSHLGYKAHSMKRHVHWQFVNSIWQTQGSWWKFERALFKLSWSVIKTFLHRIIQGNTDQWWNLETRAVARGGSDVRPPIWYRCPPFHVWAPGCYIHTLLYFENVSPLLVCGLPCSKILAAGLLDTWSRSRLETHFCECRSRSQDNV